MAQLGFLFWEEGDMGHLNYNYQSAVAIYPNEGGIAMQNKSLMILLVSIVSILIFSENSVADVCSEVAWQVECDIKYAGYIARQNVEIARQQRLAEKRIPENIDYESIGQMRHEAREKLTRVRPTSLAQASRISGITPADVALLMTYLDGR